MTSAGVVQWRERDKTDRGGLKQESIGVFVMHSLVGPRTPPAPHLLTLSHLRALPSHLPHTCLQFSATVQSHLDPPNSILARPQTSLSLLHIFHHSQKDLRKTLYLIPSLLCFKAFHGHPLPRGSSPHCFQVSRSSPASFPPRQTLFHV